MARNQYLSLRRQRRRTAASASTRLHGGFNLLFFGNICKICRQRFFIGVASDTAGVCKYNTRQAEAEQQDQHK